jgi:hypothetical protein
VSRTGKTGILRNPATSCPDEILGGTGLEGWLGIECPLINFPSLDSADFEKFQECHQCPAPGAPQAARNLFVRFGAPWGSWPGISAEIARTPGKIVTNAPEARGLLEAWMHEISMGVSARMGGR